MTFEELRSRGNLEMPPIIVTTEDGTRDSVMRKCTELTKTIGQQFSSLVTDDTIKLRGSVRKAFADISVILQNKLHKLYDIPRPHLYRADLKMCVAWGAFNAYVTFFASRDYKVNNREYDTVELKKLAGEFTNEMCNKIVAMALENNFVL